MLTGITLENFKAFKEPKFIPIKPITLVFGPNSAGKSSIIHALAFLKHVHQSNGNCNPGRMKFGWSTLEIGSWHNLVFGHDKDASMMIKLHSETVSIQWRFESTHTGPKVTTFLIEENGHATARGKNVGIEGIKWEVELHSRHWLWDHFKSALWTRITGLHFQRAKNFEEQAETLEKRSTNPYERETTSSSEVGANQDIFEAHFNEWLGNSWRVPPFKRLPENQSNEDTGPILTPPADGGATRSILGEPFVGLFPRRDFSDWPSHGLLAREETESNSIFSFDSDSDDIPF